MILHLDKDITGEYCSQLTRQIVESPDKILYLYINSVGGEMDAAKYLHGVLISCNKEVITCVTGEASSAAVIISTAGGERWAVPTAEFLIHEARNFELPEDILAFVAAKDDEDPDILAKDYDEIIIAAQKAKAKLAKTTEEYYKFIAAHSNLTVNKIKKGVGEAPNGDWVFDAKQALRLGIIDNVGLPPIEKAKG